MRLSPNTRLRLTLASEIACDEHGSVFNDELFEAYLRMHSHSLERQAGLIKSWVTISACLALFVSGASFTVPWMDVQLFDLPAAREILSILASLTFMALCIAFSNTQLYQAIIEVIVSEKNLTPVDPEFVTAAKVPTELYLKATRKKMNFYGSDFFDVGPAFRVYYGATTVLPLLTYLGIVGLHLGLVFYAVWPLNNPSFLSFFLFFVAAMANLVGIMLAADISFPAKASTPVEPRKPSDNVQTNREMDADGENDP